MGLGINGAIDMVQKPEFAECEFKAGFTLPNRSIEPSAVDFVKPVTAKNRTNAKSKLKH
jgi:hypothetical protein